jgi:hypothetical protein
MPEPSRYIGQGDGAESLGDGLIKKFFRADFEFAQNCLDFRPHQFDGIEVGTVRRQEQYRGADGFDRFDNAAYLWLDKLWKR